MLSILLHPSRMMATANNSLSNDRVIAVTPKSNDGAGRVHPHQLYVCYVHAGLINNAGLQTPPDAQTEDGFEVGT